ncbi:glycosyltransferase family 39 protein [Nitrosopumilus sp. b2]|uniref:ArnT family glycosyltransferase n=1 Tax=Nitrosopumilus sp. b2 TaxID=2109908 RepID=UPI0015F37A48|nr:glycosyltransferase family 39 protein [Nitrosopumilus sp. b2]KAF6245186.1 hypothetical protein C6989_04445 [Nitrosopumilus sp. b2]
MSTLLQNRARISGLVFIAAILFGIVSVGILYLIDENSFLYYGDAVSHLYSARRFVDSNDPGIIQMGTVWLPLPHLMMLPFSLIDSLFSSGLAGLVNIPLHAMTSVLIYKIILKQTSKPWIGIIGGILYASNPNLLYLGITAMTEAPFLLFFVASVYFLQKWVTEDLNLKLILISSVFVVLATLCRYEAWILAPAIVLFALFFAIKTKTSSNKITIILVSLVSFTGIVFWVGWNLIIYQNPFEFANAQFYAASSQAVERPYRDFLYLQPHNVLYIYGAAAGMIAGPILAFAAGGYFLHLKEKIKSIPSSVYFYMSLPVLFTLFTMFIGIGEMSQWWFNSRFATFLYPLAIVLAPLLLMKLEKINKKTILGFVVAGMFVFQIITPTFGVVTYLDAYGGWIYKQAPFAKHTADFLYDNYDDGKVLIMTGSSQAHRIMISSGIELIDFHEGIESFLHKPYFKEPWNHNKWIILGVEPDSDSANAAKFWTDNIEQIKTHYELVNENQYYQVFKLKT